MARIRIKIDKAGNPTILDVCGAGKACQEVTKNFEKYLGQAQEQSRALTESFYEEGEIAEQFLTQEEGDPSAH